MLVDGVVPVYAVRADGWVLAADVPIAEPMPPWLVEVFGGRWKARTSA